MKIFMVLLAAAVAAMIAVPVYAEDIPMYPVKDPGFVCGLPWISDMPICKETLAASSTVVQNVTQQIGNATFTSVDNSAVTFSANSTTIYSVSSSNVSIAGNSTYFIPGTGAIMIKNSTEKPEIGNWTDVSNAFMITVGVTDYSTLPAGYHAWERTA